MKFLITGASGQLGREWVRFLKENQVQFTACSSGELDITKEEDVQKKIETICPDVVVNCAAFTDVDGAESESGKAFLVNETGVKNIADACENTGAKFVHFSTDYVFSGSDEDRARYPGGYPEGAGTNPVNIYGKSKEAGEKVLQKAECKWLLIRVSWLCGRYGSNFVKTMLRLGSEKSELSIVDDQTGCPSLAFDVVGKTYQLIEAGHEGIFHVSCKGEISWADFAEEIFKQCGKMVKVRRISSDQYPFMAERPAFTLLLNKKTEKAGLHILPWKNGLHRLLKQIENNDD